MLRFDDVQAKFLADFEPIRIIGRNIVSSKHIRGKGTVKAVDISVKTNTKLGLATRKFMATVFCTTMVSRQCKSSDNLEIDLMIKIIFLFDIKLNSYSQIQISAIFSGFTPHRQFSISVVIEPSGFHKKVVTPDIIDKSMKLYATIAERMRMRFLRR